jgi:hypothetical protein
LQNLVLPNQTHCSSLGCKADPLQFLWQGRVSRFV